MKQFFQNLTMRNRQWMLLCVCMVCFFTCFSQNQTLPDSLYIASDSTINNSEIVVEEERESLFPHKSFSLVFSHFTWGAELGCSIDMTGHDQSTVDVDVNLGYKNDIIRNIGLGVGIHRSVDSSNTFIPVYFLFRSSFRKSPSLFFMHFKAGYSFNTIEKSPYLGDITASLGLGINLAVSKNFKSHLIIGYAFRHFSMRHRDYLNLDQQNISLAQISFGVNF